MAITTRVQVLSLFTELLAERTEGLFKVYIQNRFNNNIASNNYNEMYY